MMNENTTRKKKYYIQVAILVILIILLFSFREFMVYKTNTPKIQPLTIEKIFQAQIPDFVEYDDKMVTLTNGRIIGDTYWGMGVNKTPIILGDFNDDGIQDAAVTLEVSSGGSGIFTYLVLFINDNGMPKYMTSTDLGDRIIVKDISYKDKIFYVDMITQGPNEPLCCGTLRKIFKYKISGGILAESE